MNLTRCDTLLIEENKVSKWKLSKFIHVDFILMLNKWGGVVTSRNYCKWKSKMKFFFKVVTFRIQLHYDIS